jgi:predicted metal-dependent enzyme (double-stranded beta helix superfamily)
MPGPAPETCTLQQFVADLDRITARASAPEAITAQIAPLLGRLVGNPDAIPARFRGRAPDGGRGRFMLHRAPRFNVTAVVWRPGDRAAAHNHETWGVIGVIDNAIEETRYHVIEAPGGGTTLQILSVTRDGAGAVSRLVPPTDEVHAMHNPTTRDTVEVHVYGCDLYGLPRKTWAADGRVSPLVSSKYANR